MSKGYYYYACLRDYDTAALYFEQAHKFFAEYHSNSGIAGLCRAGRGHWERSNSYFDEAERLDPRNVELAEPARTFPYIMLSRFPRVCGNLTSSGNYSARHGRRLRSRRHVAQAEAILPRAAVLLAPLHPPGDDPRAVETQVYQAILERRPAPVIPRLKELLAKPDPALGFFNGELRFWLGWAQEVTGDHSAAQESWRQARSELEPFLKEQPENYLPYGRSCADPYGSW